MNPYLPSSSGSQTTVLCCQCGVPITPNQVNMCSACLQASVDITEGIPKQGQLQFCSKCERYLQPPTQWVLAHLESKELMSLCLKRLKGLQKVRLVDAKFVWTEPHSKRVKVKLTIQKEVQNGAIVQQVFIVEFVVLSQICDDCQRAEAKDFWRALVQVRQKAEHKKTFYYLEQLILKHNAHHNTVQIKQIHGGVDFYFAAQNEARKFLDFIISMVPCRYETSKRLISHDAKSNIFNYKVTYSVEIVPICKDNVICLPQKLSRMNGNFGPVCLCFRVTQMIHLIDPRTLNVLDLEGTQYWRYPFVSLCQPKQLTEFLVMDVEIVADEDRPFSLGRESSRHVLGDVWVVRSSDIGGQQTHTRTHLAHLLKPGDLVLGFDLANANVNNREFEELDSKWVPDVVLIRKVFGDRRKRDRKRQWKLKRLPVEGGEAGSSSGDGDYTEFLEDLEEDVAFRQNVNIYRDRAKMAVEPKDDDEELVPQISLQEMLDDLRLDDDDAAPDMVTE